MVREDRTTWKANYFLKLVELFDEYPKCFLVGVDNVGSKQMQEIRQAMRGHAVILMGKNTMIRKAIRGHLSKNPALEKLLPYIVQNVGFVFTKEDLGEIRSKLLENRRGAPAKAGAIAPCDVKLPPQNTGMGPEKTSFFQALQIPTKIARGLTMGNQYVKPPREGNSPYTRSGIPPPALMKKSGSDNPIHRIHDPMSLELHMADERVRAAGLSPAEREWRMKWLKDQHLHPDEPIVVDAVHRQLNPIRILYRWPWDKLYLHFLKPTFGVYYGTAIRVTVPKLFMAFVALETIYYYWKYEVKDWQHLRGIETMALKEVITNKVEIDEKYPGLIEKALVYPAKHGYHTSVAAEGKRIPTWDIESILTRAVYRALNDNGNQLVNVEYSKFPTSIDKSRVTSDAQLQLRLIAERLCTRVERRYEKRLLQQREKDRVDTDRKLADIRAEYSEQMEMRRRELERQRERMEEQYVEKDRVLRHKIELQLAVCKKSLETRLAELAMNKEHLDRAKAEFQAKFTSDVELLNQEWAKLSGKQDDLRAFYRQEFEVEQRGLVEKTEELEKVNAALKKKLIESSTEIYQMRSQLTRMASLEEDLKSANERLRNEVQERHRLSRCSYEVDRLRDENAFLKEELEQLKSIAREPKAKNSVTSAANASKEEAYVVKINEMKNIIRVMTLDTTIDCVAAARSVHEQTLVSPGLLLSEGYDDFCRSLKQNVDRYSSPKKSMLKEIDSKEAINIRESATATKPGHSLAQRPDPTVAPSLPVQKADPPYSAELAHTSGEAFVASSYLRTETHSSQEASQDTGPSGATTVTGNTASSFAERLKARNEMKRTLKYPMLSPKEETKKEEMHEAITQQSNEGHDVMEKYLELLTTKKQEKGQPVVQTAGVNEIVVPENNFLDMEEAVLDKETNSGDEIECASNRWIDVPNSLLFINDTLGLLFITWYVTATVVFRRDDCVLQVGGGIVNTKFCVSTESIGKKHPYSVFTARRGNIRSSRAFRVFSLTVIAVFVIYWLFSGAAVRELPSSEHLPASDDLPTRKLHNVPAEWAEISPLHTVEDKDGCSPFREEDRKDFEGYKELVESDDFNYFLRTDVRFNNFPKIPSQQHCSAGQMTAEGALQHVKFGKYMREKYLESNLFSTDSRLNITVTSSRYNRTFQSAIAFTSSFLFPSKSFVPQIYVQASNFTYLCTNLNCACSNAKRWRVRFEKERYEYFVKRSPQHLQKEANLLRTHSAFSHAMDPFQILDVALGRYVCRRKSLPCFGRSYCLSYEFLNQLLNETTTRKKVMFNEGSRYVVEKMNLVEAHGVLYHIAETIANLRKFPHTNVIKIFSGHDVTLAPILVVLKIPFIDPPHYVSRLVIEDAFCDFVISFFCVITVIDERDIRVLRKQYTYTCLVLMEQPDSARSSENGCRPSKLEYMNGVVLRETASPLSSPDDVISSGRSSLTDLADLCGPGGSAVPEGETNDGWLRSKLRKAGSAWSSWRSSEPSHPSSGWRDKISSAWNSLKYSEKWLKLSDDDYSSDGVKMIVLLGQFYCPENSDDPNGVGFMDFCRDYYTRLWITYRTGMPPLLGSQVTSDCGWGCMIRTTQMAIAQAIVVNRLGRGWRYFGRKQSTKRKDFSSQVGSDLFYEAQLEILKLFEDCPSAPLGIHRLLEISNAGDCGENAIGRWFAPSEVISLIKKALKLSASPLTSDLALLLAVNGLVVVGDAERECRHWSKRLLVFIPLRLGGNSVNPVYIHHIRQMLSMVTCLGILGGRPDHSLYFIGYYGRHVIYLDPHVAHEYVPISSWDDLSSTPTAPTEEEKSKEKKRRKHPIGTYHSRSFSKIPIYDMDPSCVVGFMFKNREEMDECFRVLNLNQVVDVDLGPGEGSKRTKDPLFTVQYQETSMSDSLRETTDDEKRQALEHGFELL
ncbi:hypothetical protein GCK32_002766 [Trichostrongylus colubriformis]|uniref:NADH-ubiquinone oxidoreductase B17 subunit n=3 Tax=Strongyloidea TaxID=27829 RepID=A0AAN8I8Z2_TRICO